MKLFLITILMLPFTLFASEVVPAEAPAFLGAMIEALKGIDGIGKYVVDGIAIISAIGGLLTIASAAIEGVLVVLIEASWMSGGKDFARKLDDFRKKVLPWFKYISMFNVQKKK